MNYFLMIKTFIAAVKTIETLMPDSAGKDKFDAVMLIVEEVIGSVSSFAPQLQALATLLVTGLRATGAFSTKPAA